jgi:hypothetical protein
MYVGTFRGLRMMAFGREQILDYQAVITVFQVQSNPAVWIARDERGKMDPAFHSFRAEDTMRLVEEGFTTCLEKWKTFESGGLKGPVKLGPQLVEKRAKRA